MSESPDVFIYFNNSIIFFLSLCPSFLTSFSPLPLRVSLPVLVVFLAQVFAFAVSEEDCNSYPIYHFSATYIFVIFACQGGECKLSCGVVFPVATSFAAMNWRRVEMAFDLLLACIAFHITAQWSLLDSCVASTTGQVQFLIVQTSSSPWFTSTSTQ